MKKIHFIANFAIAALLSSCHSPLQYKASRDPAEAARTIEQAAQERSSLVERLKYLDQVLYMNGQSLQSYQKTRQWQRPAMVRPQVSANGRNAGLKNQSTAYSRERAAKFRELAEKSRVKALKELRAMTAGKWDEAAAGELAIRESKELLRKSEATIKQNSDENSHP